MKLTHQKSRNIITIVWISFFTVNLISIIYLNLDNWIEKEDLILGLKTISLSYGGYLGAIITFYFSKKDDKVKEDDPSKEKRALIKKKTFKKSSFYVGLFCSIIWNIMITIYIIPLIFGIGYFENAIEIISNITSIFSWLVGAAIGFFFAKSD